MQNGWKGAVKLRVNADAMTLYAVTDRTWVEDTTLMDQVKEALEGELPFYSFVKNIFPKKNL